MGEWGGTEEGNREGHGTRKSGLMSRRLERRILGQAREQRTSFRHYFKSSSTPCSVIWLLTSCPTIQVASVHSIYKTILTIQYIIVRLLAAWCTWDSPVRHVSIKIEPESALTSGALRCERASWKWILWKCFQSQSEVFWTDRCSQDHPKPGSPHDMPPGIIRGQDPPPPQAWNIVSVLEVIALHIFENFSEVCVVEE